jgi:hypothetical protein
MGHSEWLDEAKRGSNPFRFFTACIVAIRTIRSDGLPFIALSLAEVTFLSFV